RAAALFPADQHARGPERGKPELPPDGGRRSPWHGDLWRATHPHRRDRRAYRHHRGRTDQYADAEKLGGRKLQPCARRLDVFGAVDVEKRILPAFGHPFHLAARMAENKITDFAYLARD